MTFMPAYVDAIPLEAPVASILTVARPVPVGYESWRTGLSWLPNGCNRIQGWSQCDDVDRPDEKCQVNPVAMANARTWTMYVPDGCDSLPSAPLNYNERVEMVASAYLAGAISRELATGEFRGRATGLEGSDCLESTAELIDTGGVAVTVLEAIALGAQARTAAGFHGMAVAHVPSWLVPGADDAYLIDGSTMLMGNMRVSPGPGYPGRTPAVLDPSYGTSSDPANGEGWVYFSGPVEWAVGELQLPMTRENQRVRTNTSEYIAEREAIVRFDPCGVFAVLARIGR